MLRSGVLIDDRYRLDERLATGGMGDVWRATDTSLGRTVAVKALLPSLLTDPTFGTRFRSEARMLATLRHPGVVQVYDYGEGAGPDGNDIAYLVMEYVDGQPLSQRVTEVGRLSADQTLDIIAQAAQALHAAHNAGIVHRDVKPSNLLLRPDGSVLLVDFGVARSTTATSGLTTTNAVIGTAMYMAPEQASNRPVSGATDIYALGCVAYHCLAGRPPFNGNTPLEIAVRHVTDEPEELPADVPAPARELVRRALAKEPTERYPNAAAMAGAARAAADGKAASTVVTRPAAPEPATLEEHPERRRPSRRVLVAVAAGVLAILAGLGTWLALADPDNPSPGGDVVSPSQSTAPTGTEPAQPGGGVTPTRRTPGATASTAESPAAESPAPSAVTSAPVAPTTTGPAAGPTTAGAGVGTPTQGAGTVVPGTQQPGNVKD